MIYKIKYLGEHAISHKKVKHLLGDLYESNDFDIEEISDESLKVTYTENDASRIGFCKFIEYLSSISESVKIIDV